MDALALTFSSGWASGINAYLVVLVLAAAFAVLLASPTGQLAAAWWQD